MTSLTTGTRLGPYEIQSQIGAGGMGEVYKAADTRLDRIVAIKVSADGFGERFYREAKTIASLNHPHICTLHDVGKEGDVDYLVMEYLPGGSLAQRLATAWNGRVRKRAVPMSSSGQTIRSTSAEV